MNCLELDKELMSLTEKYNRLGVQYQENDLEIESLTSENEDIESKMNKLEEQIKKIKKLLLDEKFKNLNNFSDNEFVNCFIKVSYFSSRDDEAPTGFQHINITDSELMATNSYMGIVIKCDCIPPEVQNSKIKWDVRDSFELHKCTDVRFPGLKEVINTTYATHKMVNGNMLAKNFYSAVGIITEVKFEKELATIKCGDFDILLNKEYLDVALMCIGDEGFDMYVKDSVSPMLLKNDKLSILIMPRRNHSVEV